MLFTWNKPRMNLSSHPNVSCSRLKKNSDSNDKTKKSNYFPTVCRIVFVCTATHLWVLCWSLTQVLSTSARCDMCMIESVECVYVWLVCVLVSGCRRHSCVASAPRHTPDTVLLFPRSSSDLSTFLFPSHTNTHSQHSTESMFFPSSWTALSPCSVSFCHPPMSRIPLFLSFSLSLAQTPRQLVSGELNIDLAGLSMPGEWASVHQRPRHRQPAIDIFRGQNRVGGEVGGQGDWSWCGGWRKKKAAYDKAETCPQVPMGTVGTPTVIPSHWSRLFLYPFMSILFCFCLFISKNSPPLSQFVPAVWAF